MRFFSRLFILSIPIILYFQLSPSKKIKEISPAKLAIYMKEILQNMKPVLQPEKHNQHLAKKIQQTFNGYSKEDEQKIMNIASGL